MNRGTKGLHLVGQLGLGNGAIVMDGAGAPTDGSTGTGAGVAGKGSVYLDVTNAIAYVNAGTTAVPAWAPMGAGAAETREVRNETGGSLAAGTLVYLSGWSETHTKPLITKADADVLGRRAEFVLPEAIANNANGIAATAFRLTGQATNGTTVGDAVYLDTTTAGGYTFTAPSGADDIVQIVGRVAVVHATTGVVELDIRSAQKIGTNELEDSAISTAKIAANAVTGAKIPNTGVGEIDVAAVVLDHADASPKELLAADATNDRVVYVEFVATEAAAGDPDIDVGSASTDTNGVIDDIGAGAWAIGDRFKGMINLPAGEALVATIAAAGTAGALNVFIVACTVTVRAAQLQAASLVGTQAAVVADANVIGGLPVLHRVLVASGANGDVDVALTHKTRVVDAWAILKGAGTAGCLVTVKNGANAITDAMDVAAGGDRDVFRCGEIDDAQHEIAAAGTLRVSKASAGGDFPGAEVYVLGVRVE